MQRIATAIGNPIKVDMTTKEGKQGKFAQTSVQIDLTQTVIDEIEINYLVYKKTTPVVDNMVDPPVEWRTKDLMQENEKDYSNLPNNGGNQTTSTENLGSVEPRQLHCMKEEKIMLIWILIIKRSGPMLQIGKLKRLWPKEIKWAQ
ncbi:hypothetical protein PIB30_080888 [Stylosanthes scabra]|uniref:Uncharacterized protein n=1 Tax=Stylosanthes scabra TaxID=79078 RepID=A0ABU6QSU1_9FABA|nr:hypothetical protein [Stylosanthes scabra]